MDLPLILRHVQQHCNRCMASQNHCRPACPVAEAAQNCECLSLSSTAMLLQTKPGLVPRGLFTQSSRL